MIKDRLGSLRAAVHLSDDRESAYVVGASESNFTKNFFEEVAKIRANIDIVQSNVEKIKNKQSALITNPANDVDARNAYNALVAETNNLARTVRRQLQSIGSSNGQETVGELVNIRKIQHTTLTRKFISVMTEYNQVQMGYRDETKRKFQRQLDIAGVHMNETEVDEMLEHDGIHELNFQRLAMADTQQARQVLADIEARHKDIITLESSIRELHDMILDMAMLVEQQGAMVDRVDYSVGQAQDHVIQAKVNVQQADVNKSKARKKKIILAIIALIVLLIVIGVIVILVVRK